MIKITITLNDDGTDCEMNVEAPFILRPVIKMKLDEAVDNLSNILQTAKEPYLRVDASPPKDGWCQVLPDTKLCDVCNTMIPAELTGKCNECGADYIEGVLDGRSVKNYELLMKKGRESDIPND